MSLPPLLTRTPHRLVPDAGRRLSRLFVPGHETQIRGVPRAKSVLERLLGMSDDEVDRALGHTLARYGAGYRDLGRTLERNFGLVTQRLGAEMNVCAARRRLIGAYFSQEYALEAAALFNPSMVPHPRQDGCGPGELRFVMSLRAVGEGHLSSVEFRTGTVGSDQEIFFDEPGRFLTTGQVRPVAYDREFFREKLAEVSRDDENARLLWSLLPPRFSAAELTVAVGELSMRKETRADSLALIDWVRWIAESSYEVEFDAGQALSEQVLWPSGPDESHGMEDARFVRLTDEGQPAYCATYTAYDGRSVTPHLLETSDFRTFTISQLTGPAAANKGMALFPRRIGGRYAALSRWDRENNSIAYSDDRRRWGPGTTIQEPAHPWELTQLGNCGSPIETQAGWLVFTHGVGPMREYVIGAILLDLDEPERLVSALREPLLCADESERVGYVPNVVYSCGALLHQQTIVLPYGCSDSSVRVAIIDLTQLLDRLRPG